MSWTRRFGIAAASVVLLGILALVWERRSGVSTDSTYQGKSTEAWLHDYVRSTSPAELATNYLALRELRQESVPRLAEIAVNSTRSKSQWARFIEEFRRRILYTPSTDPEDETLRLFSEFALKTLDPTVQEILPAATRSYSRSWGSDGKMRALAMLQYAVGDPAPFVPLLVRALDGGDPQVGWAACIQAQHLFQSRPLPGELLQPLIRCITRTEGVEVSLVPSCQLLAEFGPAASIARPLIWDRFERETDIARKAILGGTLVRIDPSATHVLHLLTDWALDTDETKRRNGRSQLAALGPAAAPVAERLSAALDSSSAPIQFEDLLVRIVASKTPGAGSDPRTDAVARNLRDRLHRALSDPQQRDGERLNNAWMILRLDPADARAWSVFREILLTHGGSDAGGGDVLQASTAMEYLLSIPIPKADKLKLLRETRDFYRGLEPFHKHLRETARKHLIELDPAERPSQVRELIPLYLE